MFDTPDLSPLVLLCATSAFVVFSLVFLSGGLSASGAMREAVDESLKKNLSLPIKTMMVTGIGAIATCGLCTASTWISNYQWNASNNAWSTSVASEVCSETSFLNNTKIIDRRYSNKKEEITLVDLYGELLADHIEKYAIVGKYMVGENKPVSNIAYFWVDLNTGGHDYFETKSQYLDSISKLGIIQIPELMPTQTICETQRCQPCVTPSSSP